jgi:uncharacterized protein with FMN-binding domain
VTLLAASPSVFDQPGTLGFLVVFGMGVVLYFVFRSMAKHLRKVRDQQRQEAAAAEAADKDLAASANAANAADKPQR